MSKLIITLLFLFLFLLDCGSQKNNYFKDSFYLSGKIIGRDTGIIVLLYPTTNNQWKRDTCQIKNGQFLFTGIVNQPTFCHLIGPNISNNYSDIYIDKGKQSIQLNDTNFNNYNLTGSKIAKELKKWNQKKEDILLKYPVVKKYEVMLKLYNAEKDDSLKLQLNQQPHNFRDSIESYNRALKLATIQWIETMPHSYISATELYGLIMNQQLGTLEANRLFHHLTDPVQQSMVGQLIAATLQKSMVNIQAPDFTAKDFEQENFQLNSLIGKYIVISFWASWCIPCIQEIPYLKQMYRRYHSKGLEIVSISIDGDSLAWHNAVKNWNVENWKNILCNTDIKKSYINPNMPIPSLLLINEKGMIIWNSINTPQVDRIKELEKELSNLLDIKK